MPADADALLSCRHLLGLREEHDLPFLNFVVRIRQSEQRTVLYKTVRAAIRQSRHR